ncbi:U-scoloptoxin(16)-Ssd1a-like [Dermacentor variabilis]|uniref:U-scoloptoxin(16)-Ssd1a-like n=1 Tax=Dermacentor variabilis TaxID=34621 RepID=UPI003F5BB98C
MRLETFLLVAAAVIFSEWRSVESYVGIAEVPVENGKCQFNGTEITPGEPVNLEVPCEEWSCGTGHNGTGHLSIAGCGVAVAGPGCRKVKGTGVYPDCCEKVICD